MMSSKTTNNIRTTRHFCINIPSSQVAIRSPKEPWLCQTSGPFIWTKKHGVIQKSSDLSVSLKKMEQWGHVFRPGCPSQLVEGSVLGKLWPRQNFTLPWLHLSSVTIFRPLLESNRLLSQKTLGSSCCQRTMK